MSNIDIIKDLRNDLPDTIAVIGYGSGMYKQKGYSENDKPDKDILVVVDNLHRFLTEDYHLNKYHFGEETSNKYKNIKDKNTNFFYHQIGCLKFSKNGVGYKLLVVEQKALEKDIKSWKYYGPAARLSKPILYDEIPQDIEELIDYNRKSTATVALLANPDDHVMGNKLYNTISNLSYIGDWRMLAHFEKSTKASDIVAGAEAFYNETYGPLLGISSGEQYIENPHPISHIEDLPIGLQEYITKHIDLSNLSTNKEDLIKLRNLINNYFYKTNFKNTPWLMYSCVRTLSAPKAINHALTKKKNSKRKI